MGKCPKRHDEYFKKLYEKDSNREMYQRRYEEDLMGNFKLLTKNRVFGEDNIAAGQQNT